MELVHYRCLYVLRKLFHFTVDTHTSIGFLSSTWHITSRGMFAGSCIGVIFLVMSLEFLRRLSKEYDRYILRQYQLTYIPNAVPTSTQSTAPEQSYSKTAEPEVSKEVRSLKMSPFRPHILQQVVRATLHMLQFAVAYFVMLLAMYYNGYIIICIIIGAWVGAFIFSWESVSLSGPQEEVTVCCG